MSLSYRKQPKRFEMVYFPHFAKQNAFATYSARRLNAPSKTSHRESPASPRICGSIIRKNKSSLNGLPSWINYGVARLFSFSKFRQTSFSTRPVRRDHSSRGDRPKSVKNKWAKLF